MCVNKQILLLKPPQEKKNYWKIPDYIRSFWDNNDSAEVMVKCGKCQECKLERGRNWTYKIFLEALDYTDKIFITLTYANEKKGQQLNKRDLQLFIKRLRKYLGNQEIKYFAAGEYGEKKGRAHYHIILLGWTPNDLKLRKKSKKGNQMYSSETLQKLWGHGLCTIQRFDYKEVNYLTLYLDHNNENLLKYNRKALYRKNKLIEELKIKHGILFRNDNNSKPYKIRNVKDLSKEQLSKYQKEYRELMKTVRYKIHPEFNLYSLGLGFDNFINKEYYKYSLNIDNHTFEIPPEFIRKILDNPEKYQDHEVYQYMVNEALNRKKYSEEEYYFEFGKKLDLQDYPMQITKDNDLINLIANKEQRSKSENFNRIKLNKIYYSDF